MPDFIPYKDLEAGIQIILRNVKLLIETASLLHDNRRFLHSFVFSNVAIEEIDKAYFLNVYCSEKKDVPISEWNRIVKGARAHKEKWMDYLGKLPRDSDAIRKHPEISIEEIIELIADYHVERRLDVLYVDWDRRLNKWAWYPEQISEKEQEKIGTRLLNAARNGYEKCQAKCLKTKSLGWSC